MELSHTQRVRFLYKTILRLHRGLPQEIQEFGNSYMKEEFKKHKSCNNQEAAIFLSEWTKYAISITKQLGFKGPVTSGNIGSSLDTASLETMRDDQIEQLYQLMLAARNEDSSNN